MCSELRSLDIVHEHSLVRRNSDTLGKFLNDFRCKVTNPLTLLLEKIILLSLDMCLKTREEKERMARVPYINAIGSLLHAMICI